MRKLILALFVVALTAGSAVAQTATNTATATRTATVTLTPTATATATATPARADASTPGSTDCAAFKYGSFKLDADTSPTLGDLVVLYPLTGSCIASPNTIQNNTLNFTVVCASDVAEQDVEYLWFARTQNNCQGPPNCQRAATVTPTPP